MVCAWREDGEWGKGTSHGEMRWKEETGDGMERWRKARKRTDQDSRIAFLTIFPYLGYGSCIFHDFDRSSLPVRSSKRRASMFDFFLI